MDTTRNRGWSQIMILAAVQSALLTLLSAPGALGQEAEEAWPRRVLITNDNGIEDPKILALAETVSKFAEVFIAAATTDQSGTGSSLSLFRNGSIRVEPRTAPEGIAAYAVDGYPADCVIWALTGPMKDAPPDLVISGINGGENIGVEWFGSGTVGAARMAAHAGIPAIAVSGLDDSDANAVAALMTWVGALARSDAVRTMEPGQYLTVSVPRVAPDQIKGIRLAPRDPALPEIDLDPVPDADGEGTVWNLTALVPRAPTPGADIDLFKQGWIVVIPMNVRETDRGRIEALDEVPESLPAWNP